MGRRKSPLVSALVRLTRAGVRHSSRLGKVAARQGLKTGGELAEQAGRILRGVATPADPPRAAKGGRWSEGRWGHGPFALSRYRLFIPTGGSVARPLPLLLLLHGCAQDTAAFATVTRAAAIARARGFAVLLPEQPQEANPQRCWNWFGAEARVDLEARASLACVDQVVKQHPRIGGPLFALGLSAGGAMALTLALRFPERFMAVGSHSGAAPLSARTPLQAAQAMGGRRGSDPEAALRLLVGRCPPPALLIHGDLDPVVAFDNASTAAGLWLGLQPAGCTLREQDDVLRLGRRRAVMRSDWLADGRLCLRLLRVRGLGHAWSGGATGQAFSDPDGPDALRLAWRFFTAVMERAEA